MDWQLPHLSAIRSRAGAKGGPDQGGDEMTTQQIAWTFGLGWNQLLETGGVVVGDEVKISIDSQVVAKPA